MSLRCSEHYIYPLTSSAWDEIHEVFGDGHEYDWALVGDDEVDMEEEQYSKPEMKYQDVNCYCNYFSILH